MSRRTPLLLLLALTTGHAQAANLVASVDRSRLNSGETVELTVESSDVTQFGKPDLSPLDAQFEVSGTRQLNQLTTLGGDNHATTRWIITLLPKQNGTVVIPPLQVGDY
ncbi:protein BatD, partial [Pseudomonas syringae]|nr:protein BatD [Pseudomonas syringae]